MFDLKGGRNMNQEEYQSKAVSLARAAEVSHSKFTQFLESIAKIPTPDLTVEQWQEHDELLNNFSVCSTEWINFCTLYRSKL